ncbi:TetR/AcrR family transcriptional regulator [Fodinicola acaciae]|uniref:TetR/AcrR family transcriptional regulator n=1 Tax=Fodinicola acaciae TaxID=2681555 RepID=UPI0013D1A42B|nr:TetR/AcrR family transcriptional regulator [Fodinicola acaciae]
MSEEGLRELKKRQTRDTISAAATELFLERGYDNVTIADIAAAAQVAKMTVTNYFPRKEDLLLDQYEELIDAVVAPVRARKPDESLVDASRRAYLQRLDRRDATLGISGPRWVATLFGSAGLRSRLREIYEQAEQAVAAELGDPPDIRDRLVAAQLTAAHRLLLDVALRASLAEQPPDQILAELRRQANEVFTALEPIAR